MPDVEVFLAIGADLRADPLTWSWTDVTTSIREQSKVRIERGKRARLGLVQTTRVTATGDNTNGNLSRHNPLGINYGTLGKHTPMRVDVDTITRAAVFLTGTPPRWDPSERDQVVSLQGLGIMDQLSRARTLRSALYRTMSGVAPGDYSPHAYVSMEDGRDALSFASALPTAAPAVPGGAGFRPASSSSPAGSQPLPTFDHLATVQQQVPGHASTGQWVHQFVVSIPSSPTGASERLASYVTAGGTCVRWELTVQDGSPDTLLFTGYDSLGTAMVAAETAVDSGDLGDEDEFWGRTFMLTLAVYQSGGNVTCWISGTREDQLILASDTGSVAGTFATLSGDVTLRSPIDGTTLGHSAVFIDPGFDVTYGASDAGLNAAALNGHANELGTTRAARLATEERLRLTIEGSSDIAMGPQTVGTVLTQFRQIEAALHGTLAESMDWGLTLYCPSVNYNVTAPAITLDYAAGEIAPPWEPDDDDRQFANVVVASRPSGSSYRAVDEASVEDVGEFEIATQAAVQSDAHLPDHAGWSLRLASNDELTWPAVKPNILRVPALLADWLATDVTSQMWVVNHPAPLAPDTIRQIIEGSTEEYGSISVSITAILTPASPYTVAVTDDDVLGRADTDGMVITAAIDDNDLSCLLATTTATSTLATTDGGQFPVDLRLTPDLRLQGEVVTVSDIDAPAAITYVAAGTVSHANNASITPGLPAGRAAGDLLLTLVAIRNSGTGVPVVPSGQTLMLDLGNVMLLGRIATATAADQPTITFSGGVAGADTSAQQAAFRGAFSAPDEVLVVYNALLNSSAQNIAYPALNVQQANNLILYLGWKQDDWTSVASPGTEIGEPDTTTGDDQGIVWAYTIQTTATDISAGSFTVTGGASAISRGAVLAIRANVQLATISARAVNDVSRSWPARTKVALANGTYPAY